MKGGLAYTQDHVLVRSLLLVNIAEKLEQQQLQKYFESYGCVERLDLYPIENGGRTGCVVFANPCDAAIALRAMFHDVSGCRIRVRSSYSWQQPDADETDETPSAIMKLDDHCLEQIFSQLAVPDRVHFARTCSRFRNIYEGMSPSLDKSVNFQLFESMTARDVRDFFQLSGRNIKNIECTLPRSCFNQVYSLIGMHCVNLQSMIIKHNSFTNLKINIFQMFAHPNSIQNLALRKCELIDEHLPAFKHMSQLKKLDLSYNNMITGRYMNCLPNSIESLTLKGCNALKPELVNEMLGRLPLLKELHIIYNYLNWIPRIQGIFNANCCNSLEVLSIYYDNSRLDEFKYIARLSNLRKLLLDISFPERVISPTIITWLAEHKSEQLEYFEISNAFSNYINDEILLEIGKLTALHTLNLQDGNTITDRGLNALFTLQELREINVTSGKQITDNGVLRLILACPKLQVLNLEHCKQVTDKLLNRARK